jgi:hypothetical protein
VRVRKGNGKRNKCRERWGKRNDKKEVEVEEEEEEGEEEEAS